MFLLSLIIQELDIFISFSWRDWSATIIPSTIFAVGAVRSLPTNSNITTYFFPASWILLYIYFFNLSNKITGVAEDRVDKADRPIPSGKVSLRGAKIRWMIATLSYLSLPIYEPAIFPETLAWILTTALLCLSPWGGHWFVKNTVAMPIRTWSMLRATWKLIAPLDHKSETRVYALCAWVALLLHIQDFRDIKGDAASGRKTMCIQFGDWNTRLLISFVFIPASIFVLYLGRILQVATWTLPITHIFIAYRLLQVRGVHYDHKTLMYLTYLFCLILAFLSMEETKFSHFYI